MRHSQTLIFSQLKWFKVYLFGLSLILLSNNNYGRTWIVSNEPNFPADFADLQACVDAAVNGDIILVQGSSNSYGDIEIRKRLIIMGPGYFLNKNPQTQLNFASARLNSLFLLNGSSGSIIQGLEINGGRNTGHVNNSFPHLGTSVFIDSSNAMILSCLSNTIIIRSSVGSIIRKCFVWNAVLCSEDVNGSIINNSIIGNSLNVQKTTVSNCLISIFGPALACKESVFRNNIFGGGDLFYHDLSRISYDDCSFESNIVSDHLPEQLLGANIQSNYEALFADWSNHGNYSWDGRFQLAPGSPAIGYGTNGIDCGPFGGSDPYRLSGISFHPNIWSVTMPNTATSGEGLKIQIKVNANN